MSLTSKRAFDPGLTRRQRWVSADHQRAAGATPDVGRGDRIVGQRTVDVRGGDQVAGGGRVGSAVLIQLTQRSQPGRMGAGQPLMQG